MIVGDILIKVRKQREIIHYREFGIDVVCIASCIRIDRVGALHASSGAHRQGHSTNLLIVQVCIRGT